MHSTEAAELAGLLKGLFPMMTTQQVIASAEALKQRDDVDACRNSVKALAASYDQFSLATFIDRLPPRPGDTSPAWDRIAYEKTRDECRAIAAEQAANREVCDGLADADFERIAREQIALFDAEVRALPCYSPTRTVEQLRKSNYLNSLVAAYARAHGMTRNRVMEGV